MKTSNVFLIILTMGFFACGHIEISLESTESENIQCQENCLVFRGTVFDEIQNIPINEAKVILRYCKMEDLICMPLEIARSKTDVEGGYRISVSKDEFLFPITELSIEINKGDYLMPDRSFFEPHEIQITHLPIIDSIEIEGAITQDIVLSPKAEIRIFGFPEGKGISRLRYNFDYPKHSCDYETSSRTEFSKNHDIAGGQYTKVNYSFKKENEVISKIDSVFIKIGETDEIELNFD